MKSREELIEGLKKLDSWFKGEWAEEDQQEHNDNMGILIEDCITALGELPNWLGSSDYATREDEALSCEHCLGGAWFLKKGECDDDDRPTAIICTCIRCLSVHLLSPGAPVFDFSSIEKEIEGS